ncbi:MAG TPA: ribbon-helix-helix domain-containing protein [Firmicutes bacterium]|nr:ribbon-helix-helix domain-containing protein [Candidatus Fermentithermobacillaceae bacterium]
MQLNMYVPKDKEEILARLDAISKETGKPKNEIVIEALERYLRLSAVPAKLGRYPTRVVGSVSRKEVYGDRVEP